MPQSTKAKQSAEQVPASTRFFPDELKAVKHAAVDAGETLQEFIRQATLQRAQFSKVRKAS